MKNKKFLTREQVLAAIREKLGGRGSLAALSRVTAVSKIAINKWVHVEVPRERVALLAALTGIPAYEIRPDQFIPPLSGAEVQTKTHKK